MEKLERSEASLLRSRWPLIFLFVIFSLVAVYWFQLHRGGIEAGSGPGLAYGVTGFVLALFLGAYKLRKSALGYGLGFGRMSAWLQAHIYLSVICVILVIMHSGFRFSGSLSGLFLLLFMLVIASGITGSLMYKVIPLSLSKYGREIITVEDIGKKIVKLLDEADKQVEHTSDEFKKLYQEKIRPLMAADKNKWSYLFSEEREIIDKCETAFEKIKEQAPGGEVYDLNLLLVLYIDKERLAFKSVKILSLRKWLDFHVPLTSAMFAAALFHILSMAYY